jgi:hypothetical protein
VNQGDMQLAEADFGPEFALTKCGQFTLTAAQIVRDREAPETQSSERDASNA